MWSQQCGFLIIVDSDKPVQPLFKLRSFKSCSVSSLTVIEYLIRPHVCVGLSEALLVAHTILLEISCHGSIIWTLKKYIWYFPSSALTYLDSSFKHPALISPLIWGGTWSMFPLKLLPKRPLQTLQTHIRLLLKKQSDESLPGLLFFQPYWLILY